jgi:hypothetical protein
VILVTSRESWDLTDLTLPSWEYLWNFRISWNLPLLIQEKALQGRIIPVRKV